MSGPTTYGSSEVTSSWAAHPRAARLARIVVALSPLTISFLSTLWLAAALPAEKLGISKLLWWALLVASGNAVAIAGRWWVRRFAPVIAMLQVSMIFPDSAPSRMRASMRSHNGKQLLRDLNAAASHPDKSFDPVLLTDLVKELSDHDRLTRGHSERVRAYSELICEEMGLPESEREKMRWGALLHDLGKLNVPAEILRKDGAPTDEEWEVLKRHPADAQWMMDPFREWLGEWSLAAEQHHMRWDGTGYPLPLAGKEISLAGRIVAVADAFDTMTSIRSYKTAMSTEAARREIARCSGTQFDPVVVRAFLAVGIGKIRAVLGPLGSLAGVLEASRLPFRPASLLSLAGVAATVVSSVVAGSFGTLGIQTELVTEQVIPEATVELVTTTTSMTATSTTTSTTTPTTTSTTSPSTTSTTAPSTTAPSTIAPSTTSTTVVSLTIPFAWVSPIAQDDYMSTIEDGAVIIDVLANDVTGSADIVRPMIVSDPPSGSAEVLPSGSIRFVPPANQSGSVSFAYVAVDSTGSTSESAAVRVSIHPVNDPPSFVPGGTVTSSDAAAYSQPWASAISAGPGESTQTVIFSVTTDAPGLFATGPTISDTGRLEFTPAGVAGTATVTVTAVDNGGTANGGNDRSASSTFSINLVSFNIAPTAANDGAGTLEDNPVNIAVLANDADAEDGTPGGSVSVVLNGSSGTATVRPDRTIDYTPDPDTNGVDSFTYTVLDASGAVSNQATVTVSVTPVNDEPTFSTGAAPTANEDDGSVVHSAWAWAMFAGAADEIGQTPTFTVTNNNPTLFVVPPALDESTGDLTYQLVPDMNGVAQLTITLRDDGGTANGGDDTSQPVSTNLTIVAVPDAPNASSDTYSGPQNTLLVVPAPGLLGNDTDADGDALTVTTTPTVAPSNGTLLLAADGSFTYNPSPGWSGTDSFTYEIDDGTGRNDTATVTVTISPIGTSMVISQFAAAGSHASGDFIELYNATGSAVNIGGWQVRITNSIGIVQTVTVPVAPAAVVPAGGFYLVGQTGSAYTWDASFLTGLSPSVGIGLHNGVSYVDRVGTQARPEPRPTIVPASFWAEGTGVTPFDLTATTLNQTNRRRVDFGAGHCVDTNDNSADFIRRFATSPRNSASPVQVCGVITPPPAATHLVISEFRTDGPGAGDNEFVEIFNPTSAPISLAGLQLRDQDNDIEHVFPAISLPAGAHYLIGGPGYAGSVDAGMAVDGVKNSGRIILWNTSGGTIVDEVDIDGAGAPALPILGGRLLHSYQRINGGCTDTDVWLDDFLISFTGAPQRMADPITACS